MASDSAWALGASIGREQARRRTEHKQEMADAQFQERHNEIQGMIDNLTTRVSSIQDKNSPDYLKAKDELANALQMRDAHWGADKHPSKLMELARGLGRDLHFPVKAKPVPVAPPVYGQPTMEINGEKVPTGAAYKIEGPQTPAQISSQKEADMLLSAGPLTPAEQEPIKAAQSLAAIQSAMKNFDTLYPHSSPEERTSFLNDLVQQTYGATGSSNWTPLSGKINGQPITLWFDKKTRQVRTMSGGPVAPEVLDEFVPDQKTTEAGSRRADYDAYKKEHPEYKGTYEQWIVEEGAKGRAAAPKPETLDNQYKAILVKEASGQPLTADEMAHKAAWQLYNRETKIDPGVARAAAFGAMRYIPVIDPSNPENVVMMRAGDAARAGINTPASIGFKTDAAITRYMTSGAGGTNINYFNTATDHLKLLHQAGEALNNGNIQLFNAYANRFATATGDPAPTNFETVKAAVSGELSKTFKGTGATDSEIADINQTINQAQSPQQIQGAISYYTSLMRSKLYALESQYEYAKQGKPNFPGLTPQALTQFIYAKDLKGKVHKAKPGTPLPTGWVITNGPR